MRAGFFEEVLKARYVEDAPEPMIKKPDEVKIQVKYTGVCGSDISGYRGRHRFRIPPIVSGHEYAGVIVEVGSDVKDWKVGDRVTSDANQGCGECFLCKQNRYNICKESRNLGARDWSGSFGEYIVVPAASVVRLPEQVSFQDGALIEPLAVGMHAVRISGLTADETVLVIGAGPVGVGACLSVKAAGVSTLMVSDIVDFNLEIAAKLGVPYTINSGTQDLEEKVMALTDGRGVDMTFIAFGSAAVAEQALRCTRSGGKIMQIGVIPSGEPFAYDLLLQKELTYAASERYVKDDYMAVVKAIEDKAFDPHAMITDIYPIEQFQEVIEMIHNRQKPNMKVMFKF